MPGHDFHLPPEILTQILTKLPVKSILRCRIVCKTWYSLVSCPTFISDHTTKTLTQSTGDHLLVHGHDITGLSKFSFHDKSLVESHEHPDVPEQLRTGRVEIVRSCNGLICFSRYYQGNYDSVHSLLIWNPSIGKLVELPLLYSSPQAKGISHLLGFGFDSESRDYKVVRVVCPKTYGSTTTSNEVVVAKSDIFDLKKGVWRSSSSPMRPCLPTQPGVYLCGNLHWIGLDNTFSNYILVSFNLSSEVLQGMGVVPGGAEINEDDGFIISSTQLMAINGLLSMEVVKRKRQGGVNHRCISVWSMKEYGVTESWTKLFNIKLPHTMNLISLERLLENGKVLLVEWVEGNKDDRYVLVLYNPESRKSKVLLSTDELVTFDVCFYKESLILM